MAPSLGGFFLWRPSQDDLRALEAKMPKLPFNFPHPGVTKDALPLTPDVEEEGWSVNHTRVRLGQGQKAYRQAQGLLRQWRHFDLGWAGVERCPEVKPGASVVVTAQSLFLWTHNPLRITWAEEGRRRRRGGAGAGRRFAFAHATLEGHQISGEERFAVEWDKADGSVWYEIYTLSRPATPVAALAAPLLRFYQRRFAAESGAAMQREMRAAAAEG